MTFRDRAATMAVAVVIFLAVFAIAVYASGIPAYAEEQAHGPHVVFTNYNGTELFGIAEIPDEGQYWARVTMYIDDDSYFILFVPVLANGTFQAWIHAACRYITVAVTDYPIVYAESFCVYETWPMLAWE